MSSDQVDYDPAAFRIRVTIQQLAAFYKSKVCIELLLQEQKMGIDRLAPIEMVNDRQDYTSRIPINPNGIDLIYLFD